MRTLLVLLTLFALTAPLASCDESEFCGKMVPCGTRCPCR